MMHVHVALHVSQHAVDVVYKCFSYNHVVYMRRHQPHPARYTSYIHIYTTANAGKPYTNHACIHFCTVHAAKVY